MGYLPLTIGYKRLVGCGLILIITLFISGCWDRAELEERRFILAVAVDRGDQGLGPEEQDATKVETFVQPHGSKRYRLSLQIMDIAPSRNDGTGGATGEIGTYVVSNTGESIFEMIRDMQGQVDRQLWFEHVQAIIISEAAVRQGGLQPMIDYFRRDPETRGLTKMLITSGEARPFLEYQTPGGEPSGIFLANSLRLYRKNPHVPGYRTDVGDASRSTDNKSRVLIARVELVDNVVKLGGMALFKKGKFVGYVDEYATKGGKFIGGLEKSAIITAECPEHPGKIIAFEIFRHNTKLKPHINGENIYYTLDIAMRGNLGENQCGRQHDIMDDEVIHKLEELFAEEVKGNVLYTLHIYQDLQLDVNNLGAKLQAYEPLVWEKVKERWNEDIFPHISLIVSVNVVIENIGGHK
ncbi:MAG: Ger(x)C family spore germination protein [Sporomusaceae bacterium]|nr:Ger(x)C family spore germination protein [Sporomusaceae bacterium]